MTVLRVGVIGGGLIAQSAHLPVLSRLSDRFKVRALADVSTKVRDALAVRYSIPAVYAEWSDLIEREPLDAVIVCTPHSTHADVVLASLDAGLHVLVEKPLCVRVQDAERIVAAQRERDRVVQVGYMKRYDSAYEELLAGLPESLDALRYVTVTTYDPNMVRSPFFLPGDLVKGDDLTVTDRDQGERLERELFESEVGDLDDVALHAYRFTFLAAMSHGVNMIQGVLRQLGEPFPPEVTAGAYWAQGTAGTGTLRLSTGMECVCTWMALEGLNEYREALQIYGEDEIHSARFPAPYVRSPTIYERDGGRDGLQTRHSVLSIQESYVDQLVHFHECVTDGIACRTPADEGLNDLRVLREMFRRAQGRP